MSTPVHSPLYNREKMQKSLFFILAQLNEPISEGTLLSNLVFVLFLICFFLSSLVFRHREKMLSSMLNDLFRENDRKSIFFGTNGNDLYHKLFLCFQSVILLSVFVYCCFFTPYQAPAPSFSQAVTLLGGSILLLAAFLLCKRVFYMLAGVVFFSKESLKQWIDTYISLICLSGILLFIPVLLMFYIENAYYFCLYFVFFYLFSLIIVIIYKTYILFFKGRGLLLYLFLYLCAQEIVPLFLLYKGFIYFFNVVQKDTLWL